jgi:acyl carrier protein
VNDPRSALSAPTLNEVVAAVFDLDPDRLGDEDGQDTIGAWTSMRHLELVVALEDAYALSFSYRQISAARTVGALRAILREHGVQT